MRDFLGTGYAITAALSTTWSSVDAALAHVDTALPWHMRSSSSSRSRPARVRADRPQPRRRGRAGGSGVLAGCVWHLRGDRIRSIEVSTDPAALRERAAAGTDIHAADPAPQD